MCRRVAFLGGDDVISFESWHDWTRAQVFFLGPPEDWVEEDLALDGISDVVDWVCVRSVDDLGSLVTGSKQVGRGGAGSAVRVLLVVLGLVVGVTWDDREGNSMRGE